jgi:hypothetical protein
MNVKLLAAAAAMLVSTAAQSVVPGTLGPATSGYRLAVGLGDGVPLAVDVFQSGSGPGAINFNAAEPMSSSTGLVSGNINYGANPTLSAFATVAGFGRSALVMSMSYDFLVTAANQIDYDALAAYLALDPLNGLTAVGNFALGVNGAGSSDAAAFAIIDAGFGEVVRKCEPGGGDCTGGIATPYLTTAAVTGDLATLSFTGTIRLGAEARAITGGGTQSAFAMIDPIISLPQGFGGNAANFIIAYSPNLTSSPTPEPASWAMLIAGFGLVGAVRRRQRFAAA